MSDNNIENLLTENEALRAKITELKSRLDKWEIARSPQGYRYFARGREYPSLEFAIDRSKEMILETQSIEMAVGMSPLPTKYFVLLENGELKEFPKYWDAKFYADELRAKQ